MTLTKKDEGNLVKGALVGAAVLAGSVVAVAMKDKDTRQRVGKSLKDLGEKGMALKVKAEKWAKDHPSQDEVAQELSKKSPIKKALHALATG